jgi:purine-nucleoside phosphorylase
MEALQTAVEEISRRTEARPEIAVILGSGLGLLADELLAPVMIPYEEIPHFPLSTAPGHAGRLVFGTLEDTSVAVMAGRVHLYEGYSAQQVAFPIRTLALLGARTLIITNAAGSVNLGFRPGALMLISDHINLTGHNPLVGPPQPLLGVRFPDMTDTYDPGFLSLARGVSENIGVPVVQGVYLGLQGPSYETPAEIRMARTLGADAVGMSTVMEVIAARHHDMKVLGISCITNMAAGILSQRLSEDEVIDTAHQARDSFSRLVRGIVSELASDSTAAKADRE